MPVTQCPQGHYYDDSKFDECPHCKNPLPAAPRRGLGEQQTVYRPSDEGVAAAALRQRMQVQFSGPSGGDEKTVGVFRTAKGADPVVGWLVCVEGGEAGRDFRLHAGRNFVGRALNSDIALVDDERITREDHCSLVFEPNRAVFILARGNGDGVIVNGQRLADSFPLVGDELIEIGASKFIFVPFCREGRTW